MRFLSRLFRTIVTLLGVFVAFQVLVRLLRRLFPFPVPPAVGQFLDTPAREISQPRRPTLERIGVQPGMRVLELGCGPGYFTIEAARMVGPEGRLCAVDVEPRMISLVQDKVRAEGLTNVEARVASATWLPFPDGIFDLAFLVTVLGEIPEKGRALRELRRVLKANGRLSVSEAITDPDYLFMPEVVGWAQTVGFELVEQHGNALFYTLNFRSLLGP